MGNPEIIKNASFLIAELLCKNTAQLGAGNIRVIFNSDKSIKRPFLSVRLYEIKENPELRESNKIINRETDGAGLVREYLMDPPIALDLKYMITAFADLAQDEYLMLGHVIKAVNENPSLNYPSERFNDKTGVNEKIILRIKEPMGLETQLKIFAGMDEVYRPSVFVHTTVKLGSERKSGFKRVLEKEISINPKK